MARLINDAARSDEIRKALENRRPEDAFSGAELAGLTYAAKLTVAADEVTRSDITALKDAGLDDGEILEINQVSAYFAYANRTVLGLGVGTAGDIIGLSPGDSKEPDNWSHA
jgi:alkylhydroperoxidase family enzyme